MSKTQKNQKAYFLLLVNTFLWGISPAIIKGGLDGISTIRYIFFRHFICLFFYGAYILITKQVGKTISVFKKPINILSMALVTPITLVILFWGIDRTTAITASIASAFTPIIANLMGGILLKEKVTNKEKLGTILAFIGVIILTFIQNSNTKLNLDNQLTGVILIIIANTLFVLGNILFKKIDNDKKTVANIGSYFLSVFLLGLILLIQSPQNFIPTELSRNTILSIVYMAVFGSVVAATAFQESIKYIEVSEANVFTYLQPLFGLPASVILLGEDFELIMLIPLSLIGLGIWLNVLEKFKQKN
jgi:drug/metabolite transporter (DMT)-like permease